MDTNIPDCAILIYSSVDAPGKHQYKVQQSVLRTKVLTRSIKKPTGSLKSPYQKVIADCAVTEHANLQDATRQTATQRGRRYLTISQ